MEEKQCHFCGKKPLTKDEVGATKKLISRRSKRFYCIDCLSEHLAVDKEFLQAKIETYKRQGCSLF